MKKALRSEGKVYLVGGGPGDPGLLTLKGLACITRADVVIYDALVNPKLMEHAPARAKKIFAGKRRRHHAYEQDQIHGLLAKYAGLGLTVCRLKGGDPFMFGRGGEEAEFLETRGIPFEVVPGVSSFHGVPAAAGIPLTHRGRASFVTVATGHLQSDRALPERWMGYDPQKTLVVLMGFSKLQSIVKDLLRSGWPRGSAVAVIASGTLPNQKVVTGTLSDIGAKVRKVSKTLSPPAMIVVGDVVRLREKIGKGLKSDSAWV